MPEISGELNAFIPTNFGALFIQLIQLIFQIPTNTVKLPKFELSEI